MVEQTQTTLLVGPQAAGYEEAWQIVIGQLRAEMSRANFETWVQPLRPLGLQGSTYTLGAANGYARDWVDSRLKSKISRILSGIFDQELNLQVVVSNGYQYVEAPAPDQPAAAPQSIQPGSGSSRKMMLQRAYGSERARVIQPERGLFMTMYLFNEWLPILGHSAFTVIMAARAMCYWNPMTGELRNTVETEMSELARRASVSVRTVKDVLNQELVKRYFLRYKVRRIMTSNGVRTAGILLQVRMDDPLTPKDQTNLHMNEDENWYTIEVDGDEGQLAF
jgi:hypothetical protein